MSAWGKRDRIEVSATATANLGSSTVVTSAPVVTAANGFYVGYSLTIANVDYAIQTISSANIIVLDTTYGWGTTMASGRGPNTTNKANVYGIDRVEFGIAANKANGFSQPGWVAYTRYTTTQGATRNKAEVLVAMSKNFNANATGTLFGDANDDSIMRES